MAFYAEQRQLSKLVNDAIYSIPRNQRKYVWDKENWKDLFSDIIYSTENKATHFIGSIVLKVEEEQLGLQCYTVIDGQQRLMTITILLSAIMYSLKKFNMMDDAEGIEKHFKAKNGKAQRVNILDTEYHPALVKIVNKVYDASHEDIKKQSLGGFLNVCIVNKNQDQIIGDCFKYFVDSINSFCLEEKNKILIILQEVLKVSYVHIEAHSEEDSYTIFEILNARGQELEDHELLKNYIMRYILPREDVDYAKNTWASIERNLGKSCKSFVKHYAGHKYDSNDDTRKEPYKLIKRETHGKNIKKLLDDLELKSKYYLIISNPNNTGEDISNLEKYVFGFLKSKRQEQFRPLILSLMHQKELENITIDMYDKSIEFLYKFFVSYKIIGKEDSNKLHDLVYKYAFAIEHATQEDATELVKAMLVELKNKIPSEDFFTNAFNNIGYSKKWDFYKEDKEKKRVQIVLQLIEQHFRKAYIDIDFTIEHMHPDNESIENAKIGNLIPLEETLNQQLKDRPLLEKVPYYRESGYSSARRMFDVHTKFGKIDIKNRTSRLATIMYQEILKID